MENLNEINFGVQELDDRELQIISGGFIGIAIGAAGLAIVGIYYAGYAIGYLTNK